MERSSFWIVRFAALSVLAVVGCDPDQASTCGPITEPSHHEDATDETEEDASDCEPGKNCTCPGGGTGTSVCDVVTEAFLECDCSKSAAAGAPAGPVATAGTSSAIGAAGVSAAAGTGAGTAGAASVTAAAGAGGVAAGAGAAGASAGSAGSAGN